MIDGTDQDRYVRVRTSFYYPDGDVIDVFVRRNGTAFTVTDLGETNRWLRMQTVAPRRPPEQNRIIAYACLIRGVELFRDQLVCRVRAGENLEAAVRRLAQTCRRVSDIGAKV